MKTNEIYKFLYTLEGKTVEVSLTDPLVIDQIIDAFESFLLASGHELEGHLEVTQEELDNE